MFNHHQTSGRAVLSGLLAAICLLSGCAGALRLYDENKAKMSAGVKEKYGQADVLGIIDVEKKNLDNLLAEELKVVRDNHKLQVDFALLRIADDSTPMAHTYTRKAIERLNELGFADFKQLRQARLDVINLGGTEARVQDRANRIRKLTGQEPPPCLRDKELPPKMDFSKIESSPDREGAENFYHTYREACEEVQKRIKARTSGGLVNDAFHEWQTAIEETLKMDQSVERAQGEADEKRKAWENAEEDLKKARGKGAEEENRLKALASSLKGDFEFAQRIAGLVGTKKAAENRTQAIIVLLTAAATGKVDTSDQDLIKAATVAKEIPSLVKDAIAVIEQARAPSVNNLLIELRHQVVLLEYVKQLRTLAQQRVDILQVKYHALKDESAYWRRFGDAICSYAIVSGGGQFPGAECDNFSVSADEKGQNWRCTVPKRPAVENCRLGSRWNENIQNPGDENAARELYKGLAAYLQALAIQGVQNEQTFRLIDVRHRESLASRESTIRAWDNLVAVPVSQIDAYYQAGLKPAEIADLIVKALGFTAIAVGVAQ